MSTIIQESPLRIIRATERILVEHPIFLLVGQPGIGKSSLGFSAEDPIVLNFDSESAHARAVNRGDSLEVLTLDQLRYLEKHPEVIDSFQTVVIDTAGCCVNTMAVAIMDEVPKYGYNGNLTTQGWGMLKSRFRTFVHQFRTRGKNILLLTHSKEDKSGDTVYMRPDITGGSRDEIMRLADFVGYLYMSGKQRTLDFNPTDSWFGKNPARWPAWNVPEPEKARTFMSKLFQMGREALGNASEASANVALQVQDWRADAETYATPEEFNRAVPIVRGLPEAVKAQVKKIMVDAAKKRGIEFNRDDATFFIPKAEAPTEKVLVW